jgi:D-alanyl-D-alanine carboxypeptidase (penicillin-binding protein 5/6)
VCLVVGLALGRGAAAADVDRPRLTARAAIAVDAASGETLFERAADSRLPPASTTKVMTAILALESGRLEERFGVSSYAAATAPSRIGLRPGQRMRLRHLLYAVLLKSANDAAVVVAEGLAGSQARFAQRMNARAHALGATRSRFENPHGLTEYGHLSTARDLAVLFRHGLGEPLFREILATRRIEVPLDSPAPRWVALRSHNRLLDGYTYRVIGKTGYTRAAGRCFVGAAHTGEREVVVALLGARDLWGDTRRLIEHAVGSPAERAPVQVASAARAPKRRANMQANARRAEGDVDEAPDGARSRAPARRFTVQLGPYASRSTTLQNRARLARRGYTAEVAGRSLHVGRFTSHARARQLANRLRVSGYRPTIVALR